MLNKKSASIPLQILICFSVILVVSALCFFVRPFLNYKIDALLLLLAVSILAMLFEILPVLIAAISSALIWNFFFIPPIYTFHVGTAEDGLMFLMYFAIALVNAVLTIQIKRERKKLQKKEEEATVIRLYNTVLNSLSHELKTPISTIIGNVDMLESESIPLTSLQQKEVIHEIGIAGERLNRQINNLLHMSRLDSGVLRPRMDWCDLQEIIQQVLVSNNLEDRVRVSFDVPLPLIYVDQFWFEVILQNLLLNAVQYSPESEKVDLRVITFSPQFELVVTDRGCGIPEYDLERIFDKFYRVSSTAQQGNGLGLSIVRGYTEALGGKIVAQNNTNGGADFIMRIPLEVSYLNQLRHE